MRSYRFGLALFAAGVLALAASAADDKKKADPKPALDADTLQPGEYAGKLKTTPGSDGSFTVEVQYQHYQLKNPNQLPKTNNNQMAAIVREQNHIAQVQSQLARSRNAAEFNRHYQDLQRAMTSLQQKILQAELKPADNPYKLVTDKKDVSFFAAEDFKVRNLNLPSVYDDKGNPKTYTDKEKAELKGKDKNLPGYEAKPEDLTAGQMIKLTLKKAPSKKPDDKKDAPAPMKDAPADKKDAPAAAKDAPAGMKDAPADKKDAPAPVKDAPADKKDAPPEHKMLVTLVLIVEDAAAAPEKPRGKK